MDRGNPYVWISSKMLRNPLSAGSERPLTTSSAIRSHTPNLTSSGGDNNHLRRVKTATSRDWFQTSVLPEYIRQGGQRGQGRHSGRQFCVVQERQGLTTPHEDNGDDCLGRNPSSADHTKRYNERSCLSRRQERSNSDKGSRLKNENTPGSERVYAFAPQNPRTMISSPDTGAATRNYSPRPRSPLCQFNTPQLTGTPTHNRFVSRDNTPTGDKTQELTPLIDRAWYRPLAANPTRPPSLRPFSVPHRHTRATAQQHTGLRLSRKRQQSAHGPLSSASPASEDSAYRDSPGSSRRQSPVRTRARPPPTTIATTIRPLTALNNAFRAKSYLAGRVMSMYQGRRAMSAAAQASAATCAGHLDSADVNGSSHGQLSSRSQDSGERHTSLNLTPLAKFRMVVHIAIRLRRLMDVIMTNTREKTVRSATELQWMTLYAERDDDSLAFNKHLYSRDRVITHVPDWALVILQLRPEHRTEQDCRRLHALLRGLKSFDKFTEEIQMSLCRAFTLERVEEQRVVLRRGHVGLNFYFIYSGSVFVNYEDCTQDGKPFVRTVAVLSRGDSFGELALLQDITRTATVSVREKCELLVVEKDVFASVCPQIFEKQLAEKQAFLSKLDLFSTSWWSQESLRALSMNSQIQEYKTNKVIVADNSMEDWIYACMEGKCQVIRCLSLDAPVKSDNGRKTSDIVLSEEILQLLSSTPVDSGGATDKVDARDMKENLLTSLGLDYVQVGKKLNYFDVSQGQEQKRAMLGLDGATTLTALMKKQREKRDLVYLHVGGLDAGQIFDLPSVFQEESDVESAASALMLVSGGAKIFKMKKAAFFDQASQQALDHTRTLASKQGTPSENVILDSYKLKVAWDDFKLDLVKSIVRDKERRHEPQYRGSAGSQTRGKNSEKSQSTSQIISALQRHQSMTPSDVFSISSSDDDGEPAVPPNPGKQFGDPGDLFKAILQESGDQWTGPPRLTDLVIMKRNPPPSGSKVKVSKVIKEVNVRPRTATTPTRNRIGVDMKAR
ncbi:cyclic nucleotide-binding domain-containing protein 2 [Aplysia californica]|uniref:Cyclic nucleotide-binding domain-containing protein 2 n=1 Tax=Aplysia californica TaxID=6500 RepID=A0ABM1A368_APLCA|nr:cyclic nucleotide-binding domain-containing protein 2 [Aplysia californica]